MKRLTSILIAMCLMATPALAEKQPEECVTSEQAQRNLTTEGFKVEFNLSGDALAKLNRAAAKRGSPPPEGQTGLLIVSHPNMHVLAGFSLINGCVAQLFPINPDILKKLMNEDDGSI